MSTHSAAAIGPIRSQGFQLWEVLRTFAGIGIGVASLIAFEIAEFGSFQEYSVR